MGFFLPRVTGQGTSPFGASFDSTGILACAGFAALTFGTQPKMAVLLNFFCSHFNASPRRATNGAARRRTAWRIPRLIAASRRTTPSYFIGNKQTKKPEALSLPYACAAENRDKSTLSKLHPEIS